MKLSKKQLGWLLLALYGLGIIILGHFNSRMSPYYAITAIAALAVALVEGLLYAFSKNRTYRAVAFFALLIGLINIVAVLTTAI
ncbi:hypothetical protein lacNasYZ03_01380 [Lactobacillus nasalidis]|uniref:Uncharacterized protein n=1 Tax=Lactobacillus nasalidis TaxID=2797258 RepID=A0ABQ3W2F0_9LACO|nr:hypothetical protein [Lactobacillus nasalidis]GHV97533.1 hypothetical protein lacNasYZ01_07150 [Lactobacillus nasalidis]GHV99629.1 hypothetical protein lacNasYZ02_10590 [Lactobacillus nasalidis]GHW00451.1 hypothetical protein lacNasYZ03_01380 [Lactobacillus nasalidis]